MTFVTLDNLKTMLKYMSTSKAKTISLPANTKTKVLEITDSVFSCFVKINCSALQESTTLSIGCSDDKKGFISQLGGSAYEEPKFEYHITTSNGKCYFSITSNSNAEKVEIKVSEVSSFTSVNFTSGVDSGNDLRTFKPKAKAHADERGLADGVHGATSETTPGQIVSRDQFGRAKVSAPVENDDIANKKWVLEAIYPVGSLYWSSKATNPSQLFGGTWKQIKDCFVWAKGDSDAINATGGSKTVTLTEANMPSHNHSFTPSGTITMFAHSHGVGEHTHTFTPEGTVSSHTHPFQPTGTVTSSFSGTTHSFYSPRADDTNDTGILGGQNVERSFKSSNTAIKEYASRDNDPSILLQWTDAGTVSSSFVGSRNDTEYTRPSFTGSQGTTDGASGNTTSVTSSGTFSGTQGTTGSKGSGTSFSILPPYIVKYCWERIA